MYTDIDSETEAKIAKRDNDYFDLEDVAYYLRKQAKDGAKVYALKRKRWIRAGKYMLFLDAVSGNMDDAWIYVIVANDRKLLNWLILPFVRWFYQTEIVVWWNKIPKTNLLLDVWYVGDGSGGTPLVFEAKE